MSDSILYRRNVATKTLLMTAGVGMRLRPLTDRLPKCLVPIAGKPLLEYWFERFAEAQLAEILINTHHLPERIRQFIDLANQKGHSGCGFRVQEAFEPELLGSAGTVQKNRGFADDAETVLIIYSDNLSAIDLGQLLEFHETHDDPITMVVFRTETPERCGIAEVDSAMRIVDFVEKPSRPRGNLANAGIYAFRAEAFREVADMAKFDIAFDVLPQFVGRMRAWEWQGYHLDIGTHESLAQAEIDVAAGCLALGYRRTVNWTPSK